MSAAEYHSATFDDLNELNELNDDELAELFGDQEDGEPELVLLADYGRPANRRPPVIDPHRRLVNLPPLDTFELPARTIVRNQ